MTIGLMNNPTHDPITEIEKIYKSNFQFVDYTYEPPLADKIDPSVIRQKLADYGLTITGHTDPHLPAIYPNERIHALTLKELQHAIVFFNEVGAKKITLHPYDTRINISLAEKVEQNKKIIRKLLPSCEEKNLTLMMENSVYPFDSPHFYLDLLQEFPDLKFHLDIGHCNIRHDPVELIDKYFYHFGDRIQHLHMHDNNGERDEHLTLGCGNIDWLSVVKLIKKYHYDGTITLEIFCQRDEYKDISRDYLLNLLS